MAFCQTLGRERVVWKGPALRWTWDVVLPCLGIDRQASSGQLFKSNLPRRV